MSTKEDSKIETGRLVAGETKPLVCKICCLVLPDMHSLKSHTFTEHGDSAFICGVCKATFTEEEELNGHLESSSSCRPKGVELVKKTSEEKSLKNPNSKRKMLKVEQNFKCDQCEGSFATLTDLTTHVLVHENSKVHPGNAVKNKGRSDPVGSETKTDEEESDVESEESDNGNENGDEVVASQNSNLGFNGPPYKCDKCSGFFLDKSDLDNHILSTHGEKKPHICEVCFLVFSDAETLALHKQGHVAQQMFLMQNMIGLNTAATKTTGVNKNPNHPRTNVQDDEIHKCPTCNKVFVFKSRLVAHMRTHTGERPFKCDICDKAFGLASNLSSHRLTHTDYKPHACDQCDRAFRTKTNLTEHKRTHSDARPFQCDLCEKTFTTTSCLASHKRTHTGEKPYKCEICDRRFRATSHVVEHMRSHSGEKPFVCDVCQKAFKSKYQLVQHSLTHTGLKPYQCDKCEKSFRSSSHLKEHKRSHTGAKPFQCDICDKSFTRRNHMEIHKRIHTGVKPYQCDQCQKSFTTRANLRQHLLTQHQTYVTNEETRPMTLQVSQPDASEEELVQEEAEQEEDQVEKQEEYQEDEKIDMEEEPSSPEEKPLICDICFLVCEDEETLASHKESHSSPSTFAHEAPESMFMAPTAFPKIQPVGDKPFGCPKCGKTFTRKPYLTAHMLIHEDDPESKIKRWERKPSIKTPYHCEMCQKYFSSRSNLNWHIKKHSGWRPYACGVCAKTFVEKSTLATHERSHTGEKAFACEHCDKSYMHRSNLRMHLRKYKGECRNMPNTE